MEEIPFRLVDRKPSLNFSMLQISELFELLQKTLKSTCVVRISFLFLQSEFSTEGYSGE